MISETVKYKSLKLLSSGPQRSTEIMRLVRNRDNEYRAEFKRWIEDRCSVKYRIPESGRAATMYCIEPHGVRELEKLEPLFL